MLKQKSGVTLFLVRSAPSPLYAGEKEPDQDRQELLLHLQQAIQSNGDLPNTLSRAIFRCAAGFMAFEAFAALVPGNNLAFARCVAGLLRRFHRFLLQRAG